MQEMIPDTVETNFPLEHSKLAVASVVVAVVVWIYFFLAGYILFYVIGDALAKDINPDVGILGFLVGFFTHLAVCSIGFAIGLVFGLVSLTFKDKKRTFAVAGVIMNLTPIILAIGCVIYFFI